MIPTADTTIRKSFHDGWGGGTDDWFAGTDDRFVLITSEINKIINNSRQRGGQA